MKKNSSVTHNFLGNNKDCHLDLKRAFSNNIEESDAIGYDDEEEDEDEFDDDDDDDDD